MTSQFAEKAATIRSSGRWGALNNKISLLGQNADDTNFWLISVYSGLLYRVLCEFDALERVYNENDSDDISLLSWRARNLFELSIWAIYVVGGENNARLLYEDAGRDGHDIINAFQSWGNRINLGSDWNDDLENSQETLIKNAQRVGVAEVQKTYTRMSKIAEQIGLQDHYSIVMKSLSKLAHPTALLIVGNISDKQMAVLRGSTYDQGCLFFLGAFEALERLVNRLIDQSNIGPNN